MSEPESGRMRRYANWEFMKKELPERKWISFRELLKFAAGLPGPIPDHALVKPGIFR